MSQTNETSYRVLVVDDNVDAAITLGMILRVLGHEVAIGHDGLEGLDLATKFNPHLVILDIGMPKLNGYDTCRGIRNLPHGPNMLIVALTGWGQPEDRQKSQEAGFNYHIVKPLEPTRLQELLAELRQ